MRLGADIAGKEDALNCIVEVATVNEAKDEYKSEQSNIDEIGYLGCEVLALSVSNAQIREAIFKSKNQHLFAWILDTNDLMVRAYSANALSKFAAIDEDFSHSWLLEAHPRTDACSRVLRSYIICCKPRLTPLTMTTILTSMKQSTQITKCL